MARPRIGPVGPKGAKIALVGEAPGQTEIQLGEPFVGSSGQLLTKMLAATGINRRECYITNIDKERPPGNDFALKHYDDKSRKYPKPSLQTLHEDLVRELQDVRPNITVALGEEALRALTGRRGITKWRGSLHDSTVGKVVATFHPASVLRKYEQRVIVERDLRLAKDESSSPELELPKHAFVIDPGFEEVMAFLGKLKKDKPRVSFDIETLGETVRCIALASGPREALCVPFVSCRGSAVALAPSTFVRPSNALPFHSHWPQEQEESILRELGSVLGALDIPLVAQNYPFDASFLEREFGFVCRGLWMDTMVAQHCCYCELPKSLDFMCSFYTRVPRYSDYSASSDLETWKYNCYDAAVTFEVAMVLEKELKELEL